MANNKRICSPCSVFVCNNLLFVYSLASLLNINTEGFRILMRLIIYRAGIANPFIRVPRITPPSVFKEVLKFFLCTRSLTLTQVGTCYIVWLYYITRNMYR